jgi:putative peptidoglycan lipid II flippase
MVLAFLQRFQNGSNWWEKQQTSILSAAVIITASVLLSSLTGLLSYRLLASRFYNPATKTQEELDAYWVAFQPSDLVFQLLIVGALSAAFIPVFTKYKQRNEQDAFVMVSGLMNIVLLVFVVVCGVVALFAPQIIRAMTGEEFSARQVELAASMTRIMLLSQFFFAISNFLSGMMQSYQRFVVPALAPVLYNLGIIFGTVVLGQHIGIYGPVYGTLIGAFLHMALQLPLAIKLGFKWNPTLALHHPGVKEIFFLTLPRALATGIDLIMPYFMTFFVTSIAGASLTLMRFAQRLMAIPIRVFGVPIGQAALPFLSQESSRGEMDRFRKLLTQSIHQVMFFALPASVLLLVLRIPIVRFAFGAKNFPWGDTVLTGRIVGILALSVSAQAVTHVLVRGFYALHDTRRPFFVSLLSMCVGVLIGGYVTYFTDFELLGLAAGITATGWFEALFLFTLLSMKVRFSMKDVVLPQVKMLFAAVLMAFGLYFPMKALDLVVIDTTRTLGLLVLTGVVSLIGMIVYLFLAWVLRLEELQIVKNLWGRMDGWRKNLARSEEPIEAINTASESAGQ